MVALFSVAREMKPLYFSNVSYFVLFCFLYFCFHFLYLFNGLLFVFNSFNYFILILIIIIINKVIIENIQIIEFLINKICQLEDNSRWALLF